MEAISFILLLIISFLSAIMGTMIGMAMLVLVPVMVFLGIPIHTAVATGRFSMIGLAIGNISKFSSKGRIQTRYVLAFSAAGAIGSLISASLITNINEKILEIIIGIFMVIVSVIVLFEDFINRIRVKHKTSARHHIISALSGLFIGSYIGIIGGGGATLVIFLLILIYGLSFHNAVANQKAVTLPISLIATLVFIYKGLINYKIGIPLFLVNIVGGWIGAGLILKFKAIWLKIILVPITIILGIWLVLT